MQEKKDINKNKSPHQNLDTLVPLKMQVVGDRLYSVKVRLIVTFFPFYFYLSILLSER